MENKKEFDVIVIGGGPAGMFAALVAAEAGKKVALVEKNPSLGRKLLMTGDGRCNFTHFGLSNREMAAEYGKEGDFLMSPFSRFGPKEVMDFFAGAGVALKIEPDGRVFPKSDRAQDILQVLLKKLKAVQVRIFTNSEVIKLEKSGDRIKSLTLASGEKIIASKYILTAGGKSYPVTGSTGDGFVFAQRLGHTIIKPRPSLVPVQVKEKWIKNLSGVSFEKVKVSVLADGRVVKKEIGDILFAHFGLTGPLILDLSKTIGSFSGKIKLLVDLFPQKSQEDIEMDLQKLIEKNSHQEIKNILSNLLPYKMCPYVLYFAGIPEDLKGLEFNKEMRQKVVKVIKRLEFSVVSLVGFDRAMVTAGGVALKEINNKTMQSKLIDNLYFAGEIINLDGPCGGYNLQLCWTTGYLAGSVE